MNNTANLNTDHAAERAHDARLYELLVEVANTRHALDLAGQRVRDTAKSYRLDSNGRVSRTGDGASNSFRENDRRWSDVPDGAIFFQAKTFTRGEEGYYVKDTKRTPPHAVEAIESGNCNPAYAPRMQRTPASVDDALAVLFNEDRGEEALAVFGDAQNAAAAARRAVIDHEIAYTGWTRYFLVTSSAGHVHSSMSCSSCNPRTTYAPVVDLSGTDADEAIALVGETLCTVCYPDAPVDGRPSKITKAAAAKLLA